MELDIDKISDIANGYRRSSSILYFFSILLIFSIILMISTTTSSTVICHPVASSFIHDPDDGSQTHHQVLDLSSEWIDSASVLTYHL